jgi:hypothetical protein
MAQRQRLDRRISDMRLIYRNGNIEIWAVNEAWGTDYYVYGVYAGGDPRICPSLGMAYEVTAR